MSCGASDQDRRLASMVQVANVVAVDPASGRAQVSFGGGSRSAPLPWLSAGAGAVAVWSPPSVGDQVLVGAVGGDTAQGVILGHIHTGTSAPSALGDEVALTLGSVRASIRPDGLTITVGGTRVVIDGDGLSVEGAFAADGPTFTHNGVDVGDTHRHGRVSRGLSDTDPPN